MKKVKREPKHFYTFICQQKKLPAIFNYKLKTAAYKLPFHTFQAASACSTSI